MDRPRPDTLVAARALRTQPPEGLEEVVDLVRGTTGPVFDTTSTAWPCCGLGGDLDPAALRHVVPHGVLHQVQRDPLQQHAVALDDRGRQLAADLHALGLGLARGSGRAAWEATSARSTGLRSTIWLSLRASSSRPSTSCSLRSLVASSVLPSCCSSGRRLRIGELHLQQRAVDRQRGAQLVRGVGRRTAAGR